MTSQRETDATFLNFVGTATLNYRTLQGKVVAGPIVLKRLIG